MILTINPGATSTKIAIFENGKEKASKELQHSNDELSQFGTVGDQYGFRRDRILEFLEEAGIPVSALKGIGCRGGVSRPVVGGVYEVNEEYVADVRNAPLQHPANLASMIGFSIAQDNGIKAYIVDSEIANEMDVLATYSGNKNLKRKVKGHFLNQKAMARKYAESQGKPYEDMNLIVVHMGGGNTVGVHTGGRLIDMTDALSEGPFSTDRAGALPTRELIDLCFSGQNSYDEMKLFIQGKGGLISYLGTNDMRDVTERAKSDPEAKEVLEAFIYQVSKDIGAMSTVLKGKVDAIILTGGIAHGQVITDGIRERVGFITDVVIMPGEMEAEALAAGVQRVLDGKETVRQYP